MAVRWDTEGPVDVCDWLVDIVAGGVGVVESVVERVRSSDWVVAREREIDRSSELVMSTLLVTLSLVVSASEKVGVFTHPVTVGSGDGLAGIQLE